SHTKIDGLGTPYAKYALSDSGIILNGGRVEEPMRGFDYELGMRIPYISDYVETWAYAGGYHYKGRRVRDINGFMARLEVIPTDFMRLNYEFHHDNYSKAEHYGEVTFEVPFSVGNLVTGKNPFEGIGDVFTGSRDLKERMVEPVRRDVDVKVTVDEENDNIPGGNEEIEDVVFVSEDGSDVSGDGTKDNPYATITFALTDAKITSGACKTIHVMNSSTTAVIADNPTLNIADFLLWGSGANHPKYPNIINMPYTGHPTINDTLTLNAANPMVTGLGFDVTAGGDVGCIEVTNGAGVKIFNNMFRLTHSGGAEGAGIYANAATVGSATDPIFIANNTFDIVSSGNGAGIFFDGGAGCDTVFATIVNNTINLDADGWGWGIGFEYVSNIGSAASPVIVAGNTISTDATGSASGSYGIYFRDYTASGSQIFANIIGNDVSIVGGPYGSGIFMWMGSSTPENGYIGSAATPVIVSGNTVSVKPGSGAAASGINFWARDDIFATITGNDMSGGIVGSHAIAASNGIRLYSDAGNAGSATNPVIISGNVLNVSTTASDAFGISIASANIYAKITRNNMLNSINADDVGIGISLDATSGVGGDIGSATSPTIIAGNMMNVIGNNDNAFGTWLNAFGNVFGVIKSNYMDVTSGTNDAHGGRIITGGGGIIGDVTSLATYFTDNSGTIDGALNNYLLILTTGTVGGGNFVNWGDCSFTPVGGAWTGNYDIGDSLPAVGTGPVWTNFNASDTLTP
ncbi:MAG: hypothetical protein JW984_08360, partial [Deltaproteobacteria bacterium]|nr:hypothetical protein [Candidatus Zymogenus saltonus]